ncbi:hypothetical protein FD977_03945 [Polynucleobacter sp. AP-Elch-400A-B2]|uniref:hypothetical protein n=1 Tax=Polynucleobacter sp. AP-Elch-400A-B2 TaxID=2576930 RepID=UPI001BFD9F82|nr:hypothetical protein [Polynucleobacter sp. AP-Elch-400A-B2]QWE25409.1 hypothetical protein FD977_03945 [Polynucleobacter sp. AP-Elch-400A-B2]
MASEVNKVAQFTVSDLSNLRVNSISLRQKLERFDIYLHGGEQMAVPMTGNEIVNVE